jgi:hypothetical protein
MENIKFLSAIATPDTVTIKMSQYQILGIQCWLIFIIILLEIESASFILIVDYLLMRIHKNIPAFFYIAVI